MKIRFSTGAVMPMFHWLSERKNGTASEEELLKILSMDEYRVEFQRYSDPGLPVCGISFEEAVDFFLHFDETSFENPRLQYKKPYFESFYRKLNENLLYSEQFTAFSENDVRTIESILINALPDRLMQEADLFTILLIVSIGNSMGWVYNNVIDYDISNLSAIDSKDAFLHLTAHEIHHSFFPKLLPEKVSPAEWFLLNFAYEGLAVHFANNAATKTKPSKYQDGVYTVSLSSWNMYLDDHDILMRRFWSDYERARQMSEDEVNALIAGYESFEYESAALGRKMPCEQYPTYYIGCQVYGMIDLAFGKERLFRAILEPSGIPELYRQAEELVKAKTKQIG